MVDSGSGINLISRGFLKYTGIPVDADPAGCIIRVANGATEHPVHKITTDVVLNDSFTIRDVEFVVLDSLMFDVVLGLEFLRDADAHLIFDRGNERLRIAGREFRSVSATARTSDCRPLMLTETVRIEPFTERCIRIRGTVKHGADYLVDGSPFLPCDGLIPAPTLSTAKNGRLLFRLANPSGTPIELKKGKLIGYATRVTDCIVSAPTALSEQSNNTDKRNDPPAVTPRSCLLIDPNPAQPNASASSPQFTKQITNQIVCGENLTPNQIIRLKEMISSYSCILSTNEFDVGRTDLLEHDIHTGDAAPVRKHPYRLSPSEQAKVDELVERMRKEGIIRESCSPWAAPIVLVRKKDGTTRFCCDWRGLNEVTRKDAYPLPRIDATLDRLHGMKFFTSLDFTQGYYQIPMREDSIEKTAFVTPAGQFEYLVTGMGLTGAPATFQRLMAKMLGNLLYTNCLAYLDDVVIFSKTFDEHLEDVRQVFDRIKAAKLKIKPSKCFFGSNRMKFLGHIISSEGISCDPDKVEKVKNWPVPRTQTQVKSFLGLASYYRRFIPSFADIAYPLNRLTRDDIMFEWDENTDKSFELLKRSLTSAPILMFPDFERPFVLCTDASNYGLGAVLKQLDAAGKERVIAYASRSLLPAERNYSASERECLALVYATKVFRPYMFGTQTTCYTDHQPLTCLKNVRNPNGRLARWSMILRDFDLSIKYKKGSANCDADALSRRDDSDSASLKSLMGTTLVRASSPPADKAGSLQHRGWTLKNIREEQRDAQTVSACAPTNPIDRYNRISFESGSERMSIVGYNSNIQLSEGSGGEQEIPQNERMNELEEWKRIHWIQGKEEGGRFHMPVHTIASIATSVNEVTELRENYSNNAHKFAKRLLSAQRNPNREPQLAAIIDELQGQEPDPIPETINEKKRRQIINRRQRRAEHLKEFYRLSDNGLLEIKTKSSVCSPQSYERHEHIRWVVCVPRILRKQIMQVVHNDPMAGHFSFLRTFERARTQFHWPGMRSFIRLYVRSCILCAKRKHSTQAAEGQLQPMPVPELPFLVIGMDKFGPVRGSAAGYKYVFTAIDLYTKYGIAAAYRTGTAADAADFFVQHVCSKFGFPDTLITDQGSEFTGTDFVDVIDCSPTEHRLSSARHPQTNGQVERFNGVLSQYLRLFRNSEHSDWEKFVPYGVYAYNTSVQASTGFSPHFLLFGIEPSVTRLSDEQLMINNCAEFYQRRAQLTHARAIAADRIAAQHEYQKESFDAKHPASSLKVGDYVMIDFPASEAGKSKRLQELRRGPFLVKTVNPNNTVVIRDAAKHQVTVAVRRLHKVYKRPEEMRGTMTDDLEEEKKVYSNESLNDGCEDMHMMPDLVPFRWSTRDRKQTRRLGVQHVRADDACGAGTPDLAI